MLSRRSGVHQPARAHSRQARILLAYILLAACAALPAPAQHTGEKRAAGGSAELRTARALDRARAQGSLALLAFLSTMPKGGDLHNHLSGAVYAESWIRAAVQDNLCVDTDTMSFKPATAVPHSASDASHPCELSATGHDAGSHLVPAATAFKDQHLYDQLIDAFSMRSFVPTTANSAHDHFFAAFSHFSGTDPNHLGEWIDEVATRAAAQNEQYLELMHTPDFKPAAGLVADLGPVDSTTDFSALRQRLLSAGLRDRLPEIRASFDRAESLRKEREHCGQPTAAPACGVQVRYLYQVLRAFPPQLVFLQLLLGFETAAADPRVVGINMVQPEDDRVAMADYRLHMAMVGALHANYPRVHIALHAGEIAPGLVPPEELTFHIRSAVETGHAQRIGHGVDVMYEQAPAALLKEMAEKRIAVEISLTSNDVILNVKGDQHPFPIYRENHVPVALATDDEGVSRIEMTHEYVRAVETYKLTYADLKQMARTSLEHSFLPGDSLWEQSGPFETYAHPRPACRAQLGTPSPTGECARLLQTSEKARQQFELEHRFRSFEMAF